MSTQSNKSEINHSIGSGREQSPVEVCVCCISRDSFRDMVRESVFLNVVNGEPEHCIQPQRRVSFEEVFASNQTKSIRTNELLDETHSQLILQVFTQTLLNLRQWTETSLDSVTSKWGQKWMQDGFHDLIFLPLWKTWPLSARLDILSDSSPSHTIQFYLIFCPVRPDPVSSRSVPSRVILLPFV